MTFVSHTTLQKASSKLFTALLNGFPYQCNTQLKQLYNVDVRCSKPPIYQCSFTYTYFAVPSEVTVCNAPPLAS